MSWIMLPGGSLLLRRLVARDPTPFQATWIRAFHAHGGVLILMSVLYYLFMDRAALSVSTKRGSSLAPVRWYRRGRKRADDRPAPFAGALTTEEAAARVRAVTDWLEAIDLVLLRPPVISRASEPLPLPLGRLDALHVATALIWRDRMGPLPAIATHDTALDTARAFGFEVRGI